jgi:hypothetical protein
LLHLANLVSPHREEKFLYRKICLFRTDNFTMWVEEKHRNTLRKAIVEKARAVTENSNAPCVVRKEAPITVKDAHKLLRSCQVASVTVMQFGQKADFGNKVVEWALKNARGVLYFFFFFNVLVCICAAKWVCKALTDGRSAGYAQY